MTALRTTQMPDLSAELRGIDTGYRAAKPCMLALLDRIAHINETVVALPKKIAVRVDTARIVRGCAAEPAVHQQRHKACEKLQHSNLTCEAVPAFELPLACLHSAGVVHSAGGGASQPR